MADRKPQKSRNAIIGYLPQSLSERVEAFIAESDLSYAQLVREAVLLYIESQPDRAETTLKS